MSYCIIVVGVVIIITIIATLVITIVNSNFGSILKFLSSRVSPSSIFHIHIHALHICNHGRSCMVSRIGHVSKRGNECIERSNRGSVSCKNQGTGSFGVGTNRIVKNSKGMRISPLLQMYNRMVGYLTNSCCTSVGDVQ